MTAAEFAWALGMTETGGNSWTAMGDNGRGMGRWQVHPARLYDEMHHSGLKPEVSETWDEFVGRLVEAMYIRHTAEGHTPIVIAMHWHLGHFASVADDDWDAEYAATFAKYQVRQKPPIQM